MGGREGERREKEWDTYTQRETDVKCYYMIRYDLLYLISTLI